MRAPGAVYRAAAAAILLGAWILLGIVPARRDFDRLRRRAAAVATEVNADAVLTTHLHEWQRERSAIIRSRAEVVAGLPATDEAGLLAGRVAAVAREHGLDVLDVRPDFGELLEAVRYGGSGVHLVSFTVKVEGSCSALAGFVGSLSELPAFRSVSAGEVSSAGDGGRVAATIAFYAYLRGETQGRAAGGD